MNNWYCKSLIHIRVMCAIIYVLSIYDCVEYENIVNFSIHIAKLLKCWSAKEIPTDC
jgi:hypothetical protein